MTIKFNGRQSEHMKQKCTDVYRLLQWPLSLKRCISEDFEPQNHTRILCISLEGIQVRLRKECNDTPSRTQTSIHISNKVSSLFSKRGQPLYHHYRHHEVTPRWGRLGASSSKISMSPFESRVRKRGRRNAYKPVNFHSFLSAQTPLICMRPLFSLVKHYWRSWCVTEPLIAPYSGVNQLEENCNFDLRANKHCRLFVLPTDDLPSKINSSRVVLISDILVATNSGHGICPRRFGYQIQRL